MSFETEALVTVTKPRPPYKERSIWNMSAISFWTRRAIFCCLVVSILLSFYSSNW